MGNYLLDCEVLEMNLRVPRAHMQGIVDYFDGWHEGERGAAKALARGRELCLEARGGRLVLALEAEEYVARDLEIFDDRSGEFFGSVVVNLFVAYRGTLRARVHWANPRPNSSESAEVTIEEGRSSWQAPAHTAGWMAAPERNARAAEAAEPVGEDVLAKLEEARQHWAEYQRLKSQRAAGR